ncbi:MAG: Holliday junction branch migration protein RuvA [Actinomycetota bacterium]
MIASLDGTVSALGPGWAVVDVGGVGYQVNAPVGLLASVRTGGRVRVLTHLVVREDAMTLYGFASAEERELFLALLSVNGVGPKLALAVLSVFQPDALRRVVAAGDAAALTAVPGVGKRGAQRIVLELRERIGAGFEPAEGSSIAEVREALVALGYTPAELREVLESLAGRAEPVEELMRLALRDLGARADPAGVR